MKSSQPIFFLSFHVTISNIAPNITLGDRVKACKIIGCVFVLATKMLVLAQNLKYHICTLYTARGMKLE